MWGKSLFSKRGMDEPPMTSASIFEGVDKTWLDKGIVAFDIETFSPEGFPYMMEDPVVNFSLVTPFTNGGTLILSVIGKPSIERELLLLLYNFLSNFSNAYLLTYNGSKFDVEYVTRRGELFGLNFKDVFADLCHVDVYRLLRRISLKFPRYDQKTVENCLGIGRAVPCVSGASYHLFYEEFVKGGNLTPAFYNIEDSFGCLKIADGVLKRKCGVPLVFY